MLRVFYWDLYDSGWARYNATIEHKNLSKHRWLSLSKPHSSLFVELIDNANIDGPNAGARTAAEQNGPATDTLPAATHARTNIMTYILMQRQTLMPTLSMVPTATRPPATAILHISWYRSPPALSAHCAAQHRSPPGAQTGPIRGSGHAVRHWARGRG